MSSVLLFSELTETNKSVVCKNLFTSLDGGKTFAYMPSGGVQGSESYIAQWKSIADEYGVHFVVVDNMSSSGTERDKLISSHTLLISGGNTFQLLHNLRESGLDEAIIEFSQKQNVVLAGFSAGAIALTPTIRICNLPDFNKNYAGLKNLGGLNIVDFEVFPHFNKGLHEALLANYQETTRNDVREITDEDYIIINP